MTSLINTDVNPIALQRYIDEQIYTLPGINNHRETLTILLTGSRAVGQHTPQSDVDIDVLCSQEVYEAILHTSYEAGLISTNKVLFQILPDKQKEHYFGKEMNTPHFSLTPLEQIKKQFIEYQDVPIWIWTNAKIITDPDKQFQQIRDSFQGYSQDVLIQKIKYHWLYAGYAGVDIYPHHHSSNDDLLPAITAISTMINELLRFFFLVEGKPYPYTERLMRSSKQTRLGKEFSSLLQRAVDLIVGKTSPDHLLWDRLDEAITSILCEDLSPEAFQMARICENMMITAGVDPEWVKADYDNIDELLKGELGPIP